MRQRYEFGIAREPQRTDQASASLGPGSRSCSCRWVRSPLPQPPPHHQNDGSKTFRSFAAMNLKFKFF